MSSRFTLEGIKNLKQTGSVVKSSKILARNLARTNVRSNQLVLELGAGDGVVTREILETLGADSELHSFEINELFIEHLEEINDDRLVVKNDCVFCLGDHYKENDVDIIISCLPLAMFKKDKKNQLFAEIKKILKKGGMFVQFQYSLNDYKLLKKNFKKVDLGYCLINIPPAFIYKCEL